MRTSLRDLLPQLDPAAFWQIHRGTVVNLAQVEEVERDVFGHMHVRLKGRDEALAVSKPFQGRFKAM